MSTKGNPSSKWDEKEGLSIKKLVLNRASSTPDITWHWILVNLLRPMLSEKEADY